MHGVNDKTNNNLVILTYHTSLMPQSVLQWSNTGFETTFVNWETALDHNDNYGKFQAYKTNVIDDERYIIVVSDNNNLNYIGYWYQKSHKKKYNWYSV